MRIGFIGLGVMGLPIARNLLEDGHELSVHRVKERSQGLVDAGATAVDSPAAAATGAEAVILMLPDTPDVEQVLLGEDGVLGAVAPGTLVVDMSSISPEATVELGRRAEEVGALYVDAPVSGGEVGAEQRSLSVFLGGSEEAVARARPVLEPLAGRVTVMGPVGAGQATKVVNQVIVALTIEAVAEGLALAEASGIDAERVIGALDGGFASSRILGLHGARMVGRDFDPGFRLRLHRKDIGLALDSARHGGLPLPALDVVAAQMDAALGKGWAEADHSVLFRLLAEDA